MYKTATGSARAGGMPTNFHSQMTVEAIQKHLEPKEAAKQRTKKKEKESGVVKQHFTLYNNLVKKILSEIIWNFITYISF